MIRSNVSWVRSRFSNPGSRDEIVAFEKRLAD